MELDEQPLTYNEYGFVSLAVEPTSNVQQCRR